jgi:KDO2-lipid IV(A) lauroyltransferase
LKALAGLLSRTPLPIAALAASFLAWLWWTVLPIRKGLSSANLRRALPGVPPGPALRRMMRGLVLGYFELFRELHRPGSVHLAIEGAEAIAARVSSGNGTLVLAGHFGSWDLVGPLIVRRTGFPTTVVVKVPRSASVAALMEQVRTGFGMGLLPNRRGVMPQVYEALAAGHLVVFVLDQKLARGIPVPFFGRPALTAPSLAAAAVKSGAPVHFLEYWRDGTGSHGARFSSPVPVTGRLEDDTAAFTTLIEDAIRRRPHNWLWMHDRWKGVPEPAPAPVP